MNKKLNCWEVKKCGRELGGQNIYKNSVCLASTEIRLDGIHGGKNAGRACWVIAGTMCEGEVQGTFVSKDDCISCDFYKKVREEEFKNFQHSGLLLNKLKLH